MSKQVRFCFPLYTITKGNSQIMEPLQLNGAYHIAIFTSVEFAKSFLRLSKIEGVGVARIDTPDGAREMTETPMIDGEPFTDARFMIDPVSTGVSEFMTMPSEEFLNALDASIVSDDGPET